MYRSGNPSLKGLRRLEGEGSEEIIIENKASYKGVALKSLYFVGITIAAALVSAILLFRFTSVALPMIIGSAIGAVVFGLIAAFAPSTIKITGTLYTLCEGVLVGAVSAIVGAAYSGIVLAALLSTFGVFAIMMTLYATGIIKVTHKFRSYMYSALIAIVFINLIIFLISLFSPAVRSMFYGSNWFSILISVFMVLFASFFILVDLFEITEIVENGLDKKYEWRAAYGLTLTLIWLYIEFLRLFSKIKSR